MDAETKVYAIYVRVSTMEDITQKPIAEIAEEWQKIGLDVGYLSAKRANFLLQNGDWLATLADYQSGTLANQKTETRIWKYQSGKTETHTVDLLAKSEYLDKMQKSLRKS